MSEAGSRKQEAGSRKQEAGSRKQEAGSGGQKWEGWNGVIRSEVEGSPPVSYPISEVK